MVRKPPTVAPSGSRRGRPLVEHRDVGGGAADVGDDRVVEAGHVAGADEAGGRAGQDRLDRPLAGEGGRNQRAVAAHHHQRRGNAARFEEAFGRRDQAVDHRDQAGVEQRGERPARAAELGGKLMAGGDRKAGPLADQVAGGDLVRRVADGEIGADREAGNAVGQFRQRGLQRREVERMRPCRGRHGRPGRRPPGRCRARPSARRGRDRPRKSRS